MFETRKVIAAAAMIILTGVAGIEMARDGAQASAVTGNVEYVELRIDQAFAAASEVPPVDFEIGASDEAPVGCGGPFRPEVEAECLDAAYEASDFEAEVLDAAAVQDSGETTELDAFDLAAF